MWMLIEYVALSKRSEDWKNVIYKTNCPCWGVGIADEIEKVENALNFVIAVQPFNLDGNVEFAYAYNSYLGFLYNERDRLNWL